MKKEDCRPGMVIKDSYCGVRAVILKCNPKNARVRTIEDNDRTGEAGSLWNMPYRMIEPYQAENLQTEMVMKSFEQPENEGIKAYISNNERAHDPLDFPEGSPESHIMRAICELWRRLEDDNLDRECQGLVELEALKPGPKRRPSTIMRDIHGRYSDMINKMFTALGREVSKQAAERWEKDRKGSDGTIPYSETETKLQGTEP